MKTKMIFSIGVLLLIFTACNKKKENDLVKHGLTGKIKSVKTQTFEAIKKSDDVEKGRKTFGVDIFRIYNDAGNLTEENSYKLSGDLKERTTFEYDENEKLIAENKYNSNNVLIQKRVNVYDEKGNLIEERRDMYDHSGKEFLSSVKNIYVYDDNGNRIEEHLYGIKEEYYMEEGPKNVDDYFYLHDKQIFVYDNKKNVIEKNKYNPNGELYAKQTFEYDKKGNVIEESWFSANGDTNRKNSYTYDEKGNMIEKNQSFYRSSQLNKEEKTVYVYDEKGNLIEEAGEKKTRVRQYRYEYDEAGNWIMKVSFLNNFPKQMEVREIEYK